MKSVTYNLHPRQSASFYSDLRQCTHTLLHNQSVDSSVYLSEMKKVTNRDDSILLLESLTFGMLLTRYVSVANTIPRFFMEWNRLLYNSRRRFPSFKNLFDVIRGVQTGLFYYPNVEKSGTNDIVDLDRLILFLESTGEFGDELKRLSPWFQYCGSLDAKEQQSFFMELKSSYDSFLKDAKESLGSYTTNVAHFLEANRKGYRFREDYFLCTKTEGEYFLNMIASEIMNKEFEQKFRDCKRKVMLVPACMSINQEECKAVQKGLDISCVQCNPECEIAKLKQRLSNKGVELFIVPHTSSFTKWLDLYQRRPEIGVIASACTLHIAVGGYQMKERNIASQCVILDYCGCKKHWHPEGVSTTLDWNRVLEIIGE